jgi:hypothetical protein
MEDDKTTSVALIRGKVFPLSPSGERVRDWGNLETNLILCFGELFLNDIFFIDSCLHRNDKAEQSPPYQGGKRGTSKGDFLNELLPF